MGGVCASLAEAALAFSSLALPSHVENGAGLTCVPGQHLSTKLGPRQGTWSGRGSPSQASSEWGLSRPLVSDEDTIN